MRPLDTSFGDLQLERVLVASIPGMKPVTGHREKQDADLDGLLAYYSVNQWQLHFAATCITAKTKAWGSHFLGQ